MLDIETVQRENESRHFQTIVYLVREIRRKANSTDFCDLLEELPILVNQLNDEYRKFLVDYCNLHWQLPSADESGDKNPGKADEEVNQ